MRRNFSSYNKITYQLSVSLRCAARSIKWYLGGQKFAKMISTEKLPYRVYKHQSVLVRKLGDADLKLQYNKVTNLKIATEKLNGLLIKPGETFSFCYLVEKPTHSKGYLQGMMLSEGEAVEGIGGGICQIANLIHWLCLHSPLTIIERHHHSFDPFPDSGRAVPFGCGASIFYNYIDYLVRNDTPHTFQLLFWMDLKCLNGDLRVNEELPYTYHIVEQNHAFIKKEGHYYRSNEIWRKKVRKVGSGDILDFTLIQKNFSLVKYTPAEYVIWEESK